MLSSSRTFGNGSRFFQWIRNALARSLSLPPTFLAVMNTRRARTHEHDELFISVPIPESRLSGFQPEQALTELRGPDFLSLGKAESPGRYPWEHGLPRPEGAGETAGKGRKSEDEVPVCRFRKQCPLPPRSSVDFNVRDTGFRLVPRSVRAELSQSWKTETVAPASPRHGTWVRGGSSQPRELDPCITKEPNHFLRCVGKVDRIERPPAFIGSEGCRPKYFRSGQSSDGPLRFESLDRVDEL